MTEREVKWSNVKGHLCALVGDLCFMCVCICPAPKVGLCVSSLWPGVDQVRCLCVSQPWTPSGGPRWWMTPGSSEAVHMSAVWAATVMNDGCFWVCVLVWIRFGVHEWQITDGCCVSGVILALLITGWRVCEGKLFNTVAEIGETHTYAHLLP